MVSYALHLAAFASGIGFIGYHKLFRCHLGVSVTTDKMFYRVIEEAHPHNIEMPDEVCELGKEKMKKLPRHKFGCDCVGISVCVCEGVWVGVGKEESK